MEDVKTSEGRSDWDGIKSSSERIFNKKIYFTDTEEALCIRIMPMKWAGGMGLRIGYIRGKSENY